MLPNLLLKTVCGHSTFALWGMKQGEMLPICLVKCSDGHLTFALSGMRQREVLPTFVNNIFWYNTAKCCPFLSKKGAQKLGVQSN